uniref:RNA helicase n=1 Tax=Chaetoceros debilis TaxID=122233 RepID=A0A7S3Q0N5_9STRA
MSTLFGRKRAVPSAKRNADEETETPNSNPPELPLALTSTSSSVKPAAVITDFSDLGLIPSLLQTCKSLGFKTPSPVQKKVIPFLLSNTSSHILALASTGSGKTAAFVLPMLHHLSHDPYGIYAVILTPTRELAKQIYEQVLALGSSLNVRATLAIGGMDMTAQASALANKPHFCVATPGRLGALLRGPNPPILRNIKYVVLDEADRLLHADSGFEKDVATVLLHGTTRKSGSEEEARERRGNCQTLLFSATLTRSLASLEEMAGAGLGRLPLKKFVLNESGAKKKRKLDGSDDESDSGDNSGDEVDLDDIPKIPSGLKQEYIFMPSHVRDAYLITAVRHLMFNGGRRGKEENIRKDMSGWNNTSAMAGFSDDEEEGGMKKAKSAIIFVSTCERTAQLSGVLTELGVSNTALHSLLTQNRRLASLAKFKSQQVSVMIATDVASRGLDIPSVDLVLNCELPRRAVDYIHRVGRTARAGRRGRAVSLVCERDVTVVHACEKLSGREMTKCDEITDDMAVKMLGPVSKASRLTKMKLADIGFDELVKKFKERKARDRKERRRMTKALAKHAKKAKSTA